MGQPVSANTGKLRKSAWMPRPSLTGHTQHILRGPKKPFQGSGRDSAQWVGTVTDAQYRWRGPAAPVSVGLGEGHAFQGLHTLLVDLKLWTNDYLRCLLNISKLATRLSQHPSVLTSVRVWPAFPGPYPKLQSRGWTVLPYVIQPFWYPSPLVYPVPSWPLGLQFSWLSPPHLCMAWLRVMLTPDPPRRLCL